MSHGARFCVACGAPPPLCSMSTCEICTIERIEVARVPNSIRFERCPRCGNKRVGKEAWSDDCDKEIWQRCLKHALMIDERLGEPTISWDAEILDERSTRLYVSVSASIEPFEITTKVETIASASNAVCQTCSKRAGFYVEATVQLRAQGREIERNEIKDLRSMLSTLLDDPNAEATWFVTEEGDVRGGHDVKLGSKGLARSWVQAMVNTHGGQTHETHTIVGRKEGEDVTRMTLLYRLPAFAIGDIITFEQRKWRVKQRRNDGLLLLAVDRYERKGVRWRELERARVIVRKKDVYTVELIHSDSSVGEFLDPRDWNVRSVALPWDYQKGGSTIQVTSIDDEWVSLPRSDFNDS